MKKINYRRGYLISAFNGPTASITPDLLAKIMEYADHNKLVIIEAAYDVERILRDIISFYFFSNLEENKSKKTEFDNQILNSDWCSFSSKRKLIQHIIEVENLLEGTKKDQYFSLLRKVMSYRNAFAHGEIATDGREVQLSFFEGVPQKKILSDEYLTKIESNIQSCIEISRTMAFSLGAYKVHNPNNEK